jgi:hypothetical protein
MEQQMSPHYIRLAELVENLEKLTKLIDLHRQSTKDNSMIKQYECKRDEMVAELQSLLKPMHLRLELA